MYCYFCKIKSVIVSGLSSFDVSVDSMLKFWFCHLLFDVLVKQALKSGQIPDDLDLSVTNNTTDIGNVEDDKMATDGEAEVKDGPGYRCL